VRLEIDSLPGYISLLEFQSQPFTLVAEVATFDYIDLSTEKGRLRVATPKGAQVLDKVECISAEGSQVKLGINHEFRTELKMTQPLHSQSHKLLLQVSQIAARHGEAGGHRMATIGDKQIVAFC